MKLLPNSSVVLFEADGSGGPILTKLLGNPPGVNPALVDPQGRATPIFRQYLGKIGATPLPTAETPLVDAQRRALPVFTKFLMALK